MAASTLNVVAGIIIASLLILALVLGLSTRRARHSGKLRTAVLDELETGKRQKHRSQRPLPRPKQNHDAVPPVSPTHSGAQVRFGLSERREAGGVAAKGRAKSPLGRKDDGEVVRQDDGNFEAIWLGVGARRADGGEKQGMALSRVEQGTAKAYMRDTEDDRGDEMQHRRNGVINDGKDRGRWRWTLFSHHGFA